ncbi:MAG: hypothetical protein UU10_C0041G0008 [Parcubacteria group bacterium GW2011_GWF1_40_6]|nr:MAG: hypothetical protein UU10_C0041G0008 [Parcubacteria group bacterium GW2011_GWF1_40_6]HLA29311.1 hypothetical protein [Syntrophales bacterium]
MALLIDFTGAATVHSGATFANSNVTDIGTPYHSPGGVWSIAKVRLDTANVPGTKTSTDVYQMIAVPAYTWCLGCWFKVIEAELTATTATIAIGDGDSTAGYLTAVQPSTTVGTIHAPLYGGSEAFNVKAGRMYPAADTIDVLVGTAAFTSSNGVYDIYALLMSYNVPF